jgi:hypothetical protein
MKRFHRPDNRQVADVEEQLHPSLTHPPPSNAEEVQSWLLSTQRTGKIAPMEVPRGFSRYDQQTLSHLIIIQAIGGDSLTLAPSDEERGGNSHSCEGRVARGRRTIIPPPH